MNQAKQWLPTRALEVTDLALFVNLAWRTLTISGIHVAILGAWLLAA